jgi:hypothetical protein
MQRRSAASLPLPPPRLRRGSGSACARRGRGGWRSGGSRACMCSSPWGELGGVQAELSAGSKNGEREREVEREQARELRGELEYSGTASFSLLFIPFFLLDFFLPFPLRFIFVFVFDTFNRGESLLVLVGPCKSHQRYFSAPF